jgi:protein-S-isoprenylcysteine O-methyltransferase Ste14
MRPLPFVLPHAIFFWAVWVWSFLPEYKIVNTARNEAKKEGSKDAGSIQVIMASMWIALFMAFAVAWLPATQFPPRWRIIAFYVGIAALVAGGLLRRACWRALGEYFTGDVKARADQPVIQTGPYEWVRHPSYTGGILMFVGIGIALTNWLSVLLAFVGTVAAYSYRVKVEERALLSEIGEPYAEYMRTHKRYIPFVV